MSWVLFLSLILCKGVFLKLVKKMLKFNDLLRKGGGKERKRTIFRGLKHQTTPAKEGLRDFLELRRNEFIIYIQIINSVHF